MHQGWYLPLIAFVLLAWLERRRRDPAALRYARSDWLLNLAGLAVQGVLVPLAGFFIATRVLAEHLPGLAGVLPLGWFGAFLLNFVVVDFLYYWQHRLFHRVPFLWAMHRCHHASPTVDVWATSRNALAINFLFVYLLLNPLLGFLCDAPDGFFVAAGLTAALDLWRHSRLPVSAGLGRLLVTPWHHHLHHSPEGAGSNYGANLMLWDRCFGTAREASAYPRRYGLNAAPGAWRQFLFPW
ncbi:sterol desaturase/sphingolipid hydroxylase (fatty acid hydroxylase superfamily) [Tahibacter aquaticus]|jgi:sterol desaturase/sphingolipid hydroxylase (fatty acid hydroxylase superfamily)|uniref:Sterol desaturase/sphingolipid hydroxylase (Fatty acid hydroxylase superfamily) n=1 Tax=Tahibacter aquaticus TaxID=520092 RepID=A0A4R6Z0J4_9GAMM|nr:sterol desaturase family protein [Tahibacter aquaticus]TDR45022.1 sterol desaturase/sphingolipid hydroxylase (fatty acid hydroxylase superfamily) [Tahibacter aquaticus]